MLYITNEIDDGEIDTSKDEELDTEDENEDSEDEEGDLEEE